MVFIGIDPGKLGALAAVEDKGELVGVWDTPVLKVGTRLDYDYPAIADILWKLTSSHKCYAVLELIHAFPKAGLVAMYGMGEGSGLWKGYLGAMKIPFETVSTRVWKKTMLNGVQHSKQAAIHRAKMMFPSAPLFLKKHDGRAEAILMAVFCRRLMR